jgi:hypothetical protein
MKCCKNQGSQGIGKARAEPSRADPSRAEPSRAEPGRAEPSRAEPSRAEPSQAEPSRAGPSRAEPSRAEPSRAEPSLEISGESFGFLCISMHFPRPQRAAPPAGRRPERKSRSVRGNGAIFAPNKSSTKTVGKRLSPFLLVGAPLGRTDLDACKNTPTSKRSAPTSRKKMRE